MLSFLLLAIALVLFFLEFFLPGGVLGGLAGLFLMFSITAFIYEGHSGLALLGYIIAIGVLLTLMIKFALKRIRSTQPQQSIYADDSQEGFFASSFDSEAIGKVGKVITDLKPGGYILIGTEKFQALSLEGYIAKDVEVLVIGGQGESLLVKVKK